MERVHAVGSAVESDVGAGVALVNAPVEPALHICQDLLHEHAEIDPARRVFELRRAVLPAERLHLPPRRESGVPLFIE